MRLALVLATTLLLISTATPTIANPCWSTSHAEVDTGVATKLVGGPRHYVDVDSDILPWLYEETNGIEGLQRGDPNVDDTCGGQIESDLWIF